MKEEPYASTNAVNKTVLSRCTEQKKKVLLQKMEGENRQHSHMLGVRSDKCCRIYHCTGVKTSIYDQLQLQIKWRHSYYPLFNVFRLINVSCCYACHRRRQPLSGMLKFLDKEIERESHTLRFNIDILHQYFYELQTSVNFFTFFYHLFFFTQGILMSHETANYFSNT